MSHQYLVHIPYLTTNPRLCPARSQCFMADLQWSTMRRVGVRSLMLFCSHRKKWISFF